MWGGHVEREKDESVKRQPWARRSFRRDQQLFHRIRIGEEVDWVSCERLALSVLIMTIAELRTLRHRAVVTGDVQCTAHRYDLSDPISNAVAIGTHHKCHIGERTNRDIRDTASRFRAQEIKYDINCKFVGYDIQLRMTLFK